MKYPKKLEQGAVIGLVAPSSPVSEERQQQSIEVLKSLGFKVKTADNLSASKGGYMAGEEEVRAQWLNKMFADEEVDAVFCLRGGDGANRIIEYLDLDVIRNNPKIFVGYSDITCLHLVMGQQCDLITFHGPMVSSNMVDHFDDESKTAFFDALTADDTYTYKAPKGLPVCTSREGKAEGILTGGNLSLICTSIGTPYEIDTDGKILFIEELNDHIGNLDREIYQLKNAGKLKGLKGLILGQFTNIRVDEEGFDVVKVFEQATAGLDIPIMYNVQSGHGFPMINIPIGAPCAMDTATGEITFKIER